MNRFDSEVQREMQRLQGDIRFEPRTRQEYDYHPSYREKDSGRDYYESRGSISSSSYPIEGLPGRAPPPSDHYYPSHLSHPATYAANRGDFSAREIGAASQYSQPSQNGGGYYQPSQNGPSFQGAYSNLPPPLGQERGHPYAREQPPHDYHPSASPYGNYPQASHASSYPPLSSYPSGQPGSSNDHQYYDSNHLMNSNDGGAMPRPRRSLAEELHTKKETYSADPKPGSQAGRPSINYASPSPGTGMQIGSDLNEDKFKKRQMQEEYRRQL